MTGAWTLVCGGWDPADEGRREALCTLGNGRFATRGAAPGSAADGVHYPGTCAAGGYNRLSDEIGGRVVENESMVNLPNWLDLRFAVGDGEWVDLSQVRVLAHRVELDLRGGVLRRRTRFVDAAGRTTTVVDGTVENTGVPRYRGTASRHLDAVTTSRPALDTVLLVARTFQSQLRIAVAARTRGATAGPPRARDEPGRVTDELELQLSAGFGAEGVHLGSMAGCVDLVQRCFAGLETRRDALWFNPHWPRRFGPLSLAVQYRGQALTVEVSGREVRVSAEPGPGAPVDVGCGDDEDGHRAVEVGEAKSWRAGGGPP